jgi:hypothetical protein
MIPGARFIDETSHAWLAEILEAQAADEDTFLTSPAYLLHTGRRGLWLLGDSRQFVTYCRHPNRRDALLVLPQPGCLDIDFWRYVLRTLARHSPAVTLGRVHSRYRDQLDAASDLVRHEEEILDWRFPCSVLENGALANPVGRSFSAFRKRLGRLSAREARTMALSSATDRRLIDQTRELIGRWASLVASLGRFRFEDLLESNYNGLRIALTGHCPGFNGALVVVDSRVVAFFTSETPLNGDTVNGITMCVDRELDGAAELAHQAMAQLHLAQGFRFTNINGAETESLDRFRRKLRPARRYTIDSYHHARPA